MLLAAISAGGIGPIFNVGYIDDARTIANRTHALDACVKVNSAPQRDLVGKYSRLPLLAFAFSLASWLFSGIES